MSRHHQLAQEAKRCHAEGKYLSGYMASREAASEAGRYGDHQSSMIYLTNALQSGGKANVAPADLFRLLFELRLLTAKHPDDVPTGMNVNFRGLIQLKMFEHTLAHNPLVADLRQRLDEMTDATVCDRHLSASQFHTARGESAEARVRSESAWSAYFKSTVVPDCSSIQHKTVYALAAFSDGLDCDDRTSARQWLDAARRELETHDCENCRRNYLREEVSFALACHEPTSALRARLADVRNQEVHIEAVYYTDYLAADVHLINPNNGDPENRSHPARIELTRRPTAGAMSVTDKYTHALAVQEFRLASVRYAAGVPPMNDSWPVPIGEPEPPPQPVVPAPRVDVAELHRRVTKARQASDRAMRAAATLDGMLECDFRQKAVRTRQDRLAAIAAACGVPD